MRLAIGALIVATIVYVASPASVLAQSSRPRRPASTVEGTVTVNVSDQEHILPILCYERGRPEAGFVTDRGPREDPYHSLIRLTGLAATDARGYRVALTDGARFFGGTVPSFRSVGGVMSATTTVALNEREMDITFEANCTARTADPRTP